MAKVGNWQQLETTFRVTYESYFKMRVLIISHLQRIFAKIFLSKKFAKIRIYFRFTLIRSKIIKTNIY